MADITTFPVKIYWTHKRIAEARDRSAMAESVMLPIDQFLELLDIAERSKPQVRV